MQDETERSSHEQMRGLWRRLAFLTLTALARLLAVSADRHTDVNGFIGTCIGTITEEPAQTASSLCFRPCGMKAAHLAAIRTASMTPTEIYIDCS
jgi:hypothetical protein